MEEPLSLATKIRATVVTLVLAGGLIFAGIACFQQLSIQAEVPESEGFGPRTAVRILRAVSQDYQDVLRGYGRVRALRMADVSAEVPGLVLSIDPVLEAGNPVGTEKDLVILDDRDLKDALANATATVEQREAALRGSKATLVSLNELLVVARSEHEISKGRLKSLLELEQTSSSARDDVDVQRLQTAAMARAVLSLEQQVATTQQAIMRAQAEVRAAKALEGRAANDLARTRITAPYEGTIQSRTVQPGNWVVPGTILFSLVDLDVVEVPIKIGASLMGEVKRGASARLMLKEDSDAVWSGTVARIAPTVDPRERTMTVYLEVEAKDTKQPVPPGAFVVGEVDGRLFKNVIALPRTALIAGVAFIIERDVESEDAGVVRARRPAIRRLLPEIALIESGIEAGEEVVTTNLEQLADGVRVKIVRELPRGVETNGASDQ
jgi:RND family efflux transporter MFP subunit